MLDHTKRAGFVIPDKFQVLLFLWCFCGHELRLPSLWVGRTKLLLPTTSRLPSLCEAWTKFLSTTGTVLPASYALLGQIRCEFSGATSVMPSSTRKHADLGFPVAWITLVVPVLVPMRAPMTVRVLLPSVAPAVALVRVPMHVCLAVLEIVPVSLPRHVSTVVFLLGGGANAVAMWRVVAWL